MEVVITKVGVVTPWGRGLQSFKDGFVNQDIALQPHQPLQYLQSDLAGIAANKAFAQYLLQRKASKLMTPAARLAMDAVGQILEGLQINREDCGLFVSVGREPPDEGEAEPALLASVEEGLFCEKLLATEGQRLYPPLLPLKTLPNMILGHLAMHFELQGENAACAGEGVSAIWEGYWSIVEGRCKQALVGAADSLVDLGQARDLQRVGIQTPPGQASVAFLLESEQEAKQANRTPIVHVSHQPLWYTKRRRPNQIGEKFNSLIGHCGVVMPQLELLSLICGLQRGSSWNGLDVFQANAMYSE